VLLGKAKLTTTNLRLQEKNFKFLFDPFHV